jgi:hypothetical protein
LYPIPSYNIQIYGAANFQENLKPFKISGAKEKRIQNVAVSGSTGGKASVIIYSLDGRDVLGPYTVYVGETLSVEIDERDWGVLVESEDDIQVTVWISEEEKGAKQSEF